MSLARRDRAREHYQSVVHFQPIQPAMFDTPLLYTPDFDRSKYIEYRPNTLESSLPSNVIGDLDVEATFNLINPTLYAAPGPAGATASTSSFLLPYLPMEDLELLPQSLVERDPLLRKQLTSRDGRRRPIGWLRYTEYTEMLDPTKARRQLQRKRQATLLEQPRPAVQSDFAEAAEGLGELDMVRGVERTFRMARELDLEWAALQEGEQQPPQPPPQPRRLVHPNPAKRDARPVAVRPVFPNSAGWENDYFSVHFLDGNPVPVERLVEPSVDFYALPPHEQQRLIDQSRDHEDALLLQLADEDADAVYLLKRKRDEGEDDEAGDEEAKRRRGEEYERAADYQLVQHDAERRELVFLFDGASCRYQPLEGCVSVRRKPAPRGRDRRAAAESFVVEPAPLTEEQQLARKEKARSLLEPPAAVKAEEEAAAAFDEEAEPGAAGP